MTTNYRKFPIQCFHTQFLVVNGFCKCLIIPGTAGMKRRSLALQAKFTADGIVDTLRRCGAAGVTFVCAHGAGAGAGAGEQNDDVNVPLVRSQV